MELRSYGVVDKAVLFIIILTFSTVLKHHVIIPPEGDELGEGQGRGVVEGRGCGAGMRGRVEGQG